MRIPKMSNVDRTWGICFGRGERVCGDGRGRRGGGVLPSPYTLKARVYTFVNKLGGQGGLFKVSIVPLLRVCN